MISDVWEDPAGVPVDAIFFCNAIHLVHEKELVLQEIRKTLRDEGTFSFNTSFYDGAEPPESEQFYRKWMMRALRALKTNYGILPDKTKVEARVRLTAEDYSRLLEENGFKIRRKEVITVDMPLSGFEAISDPNAASHAPISAWLPERSTSGTASPRYSGGRV